ncbi:MAG TPA: biotin carboxylase N-terminal domain-containing protein [Candidatus Dormibacteraeota bacterium]|nr:biotin carboxylase N-terminal domain-containing protein [Candidatus Dormibacteraeota bacterium]
MNAPLKPIDPYSNNPLVHRDRRLGQAESEWVRTFACDDMRVLIVCRGPVRKEAIEVFREMGMSHVGMLLSERDSIVFSRALSPEVRILDPHHVHPVPDYSGGTKEERRERIQQIIAICRTCGYDYVFAGYGFMAEDAYFVRSIEEAGLRFIGPGSYTQSAAGAKDEAKRTAIENQVSVTPGINDATVRTLLRKYPDRRALRQCAKQHRLEVAALNGDGDLSAAAEALLEASYHAHIDLFSVDELATAIQDEAARLIAENPGRRFRLKAIGGGGGKGQRIFSAADGVPGLVREILAEVKAGGVGDNKNMLIELNVESTRHNEIQMLGNGAWCVTLGGRDCSLQMHEQKLIEVSITQEGLRDAIERARAGGDARKAAVLTTDLGVLERMEAEAERFGRAVKLDSASTFECIVEGDRHYFMEVNTRIQVEHRVSELCYALRFSDPGDPAASFEVHSLIEAMALIARHGTRLPRPTRVQRDGAALEVRLNATDGALQPAAGGVMVSWSDPIELEIRDDQGISLKNPDTGLFMRYRLAGAYDSNVALLLATGATREESWARLTEVLRRTRLRGIDLATNREFHLGLMNWFLHRDPWAKPTTNFVVPYLTMVGLIEQEAQEIDLEYAFHEVERRRIAEIGPEARTCFDHKETLIERPLRLLFQEPHFLSAWLSQHMRDFTVSDGRVTWQRNPVEILCDTYRLLDMIEDATAPAAEAIWGHDRELLDTALAFYAGLARHLPAGLTWEAIDNALRSTRPAFGIDAERWARVRASHLGHQLGLEILAFVPLIGTRAGFYELRLGADLTPIIPARLHDPALQDAMKRVLVPPPAMRSDEIVATMGGVYWDREAPTLPPFLHVGSHFEKGQPLYIIEVMKMFNKVYAPFAGTVMEIVMHEPGVVVHKGETLFKVEPDEKLVVEDPRERAARIRARTDEYLTSVL